MADVDFASDWTKPEPERVPSRRVPDPMESRMITNIEIDHGKDWISRMTPFD